MWQIHMIGDSRMKKIVSVDDAGEKPRGAAEGAAQRGPRQHVDHGRDLRREPHDEDDREQRMPASGRMKSAGVGAAASASVPTTSSPIQAGEPRNISIAKASWKRLTSFMPGHEQEMASIACCPGTSAGRGG